MNFFKKVVFKLLSKFHLEFNCVYDYIRFKKYYTNEKSNNTSKLSLKSWILQDKHRVEKALTLPNPRFGFGEEVLSRLCSNLLTYKKLYLKDDTYYIGVGSLVAYRKFHLLHNEELPTFFLKVEPEFNADFNNDIINRVGLMEVNPKSNISSEDFKKFAYSRVSCRDFDMTKEVNKSTLDNVMEIAIKAPSVCNRQHWKLHVFSNEKAIEILELQNGNTGFTYNIPYIGVITSDLNAFYTEHERNQPFTDGGIFGMNLMYALHSHDISSCALNWCNSFRKDIALYKLGYIPENETTIFIVAFGYQKVDSRLAKSPRLSVEDCISYH